MVIFFMSNVDLSGESPMQSSPPTTQRTPSGDLDPNILLKRDARDGFERRCMRLVLSLIVLAFAVMFLWKGLFFALDVGNGLLSAKSSIVTALTQKNELIECMPQTECVVKPKEKKQSKEQIISQPKVEQKSGNNIPDLSTDWLSTGSLIAIVAFILGVGLTLLLTLLKSAFHHPTDKDLNSRNSINTVELATPISELVLGVLVHLREKLSK